MSDDAGPLESWRQREKARLHRVLAEARRTVGPFDWAAWRQSRDDLVTQLRNERLAGW